MGVARGTLRTALQRLETSGHITRRQGSGTFVVRPINNDRSASGMELLESFDEMAVRQGRHLRLTGVTVTRRDPVPEAAARSLGLGAHQTATVVRREFLVDGVPGLFMVDVVHPSVSLPPARDLRRALTAGTSMLEVMSRSGVEVAYVTTSITARLVDPGEPAGRSLGAVEPTALLELTEVAHRASGAPVKHSQDLVVPGALDLRVVRSVAPDAVGQPPTVIARSAVR